MPANILDKQKTVQKITKNACMFIYTVLLFTYTVYTGEQLCFSSTKK